MTPFAGGIPRRPHIKVFPPEKKKKNLLKNKHSF